ncbi:MAG: hypothetical protein NVV63_14830 [Opitutus sp.]|nr:hypothetical protein [Opitutus sp.]
MNRLSLVLSVLVLAGAAIAAALYWRLVETRAHLQTQLVSATGRANDLQRQLTTAHESIEDLNTRLTALDADLGETKSKLTFSETKNAQLGHELTQTKNLLAARELASAELGRQIQTLRDELTEARAQAASAEELEDARATIAQLERQLAEAKHGAAASDTASATAVFSSRPRALVLSVGPSSSFVILNYGSDRGAAAGQTLTIQRGTDVLAKVLISDARPAFSVAQVQPDSLHGVLQKGDFAILTQ